MTHEEAKELLPAYAINAVGSLEKVKVQAHIQTCDQCQRLLREHLEAAGLLAFSTDPVIPSKGLRKRLIGEVSAPAPERAASAPAAPSRPVRAVLVLLVAGLFIALIASLLLPRRGSDVSQLDQDVIAILASEDLTHSPMLSSGEMRAASGQIFYGPEGGTVAVVMKGLEDPKGRFFMMWVFVDERAAPLGSFDIFPNGTAVVLVKGVPEAMQGILVTLEDSSETRVPQGHVILHSPETRLQ